MMDITKEKFWDVEYEEQEKESSKKSSKENKMIAIGLMAFAICTFTNIALIYGFFKILNML